MAKSTVGNATNKLIWNTLDIMMMDRRSCSVHVRKMAAYSTHVHTVTRSHLQRGFRLSWQA
jgi:hypothetical protein